MHIGIDLGGTKIEIIVMSNDSTLYQKRVPSPQGDYQATLNKLVQLIADAEEHVDRTCSIGIGIPGSVDKNQQIKNANSTWLIGHDLKNDLSNALERSVAIANDADCFTLSEATDGAGQNDSFVFGVILGTGVGGGFTQNKRLFSGPNSIAGEWGHNPLPMYNQAQVKDAWGNGRVIQCYCGQENCIETFLSGPAMSQRYAFDANLSASETLTSYDIIERSRNGDLPAHKYFSKYIDQLGRALANVININDPDIVVIGGGLSNIEEIYDLLPSAIEPYIFASGKTKESPQTPIVQAKHGDASGVRGAAWLGANLNS